MMFAFAAAAPVHAEAAHKTVVSGRCQYPDRLARYRNETILILCDTATIDRNATSLTLGFDQRSWGRMAGFTGDMVGDKMAVSQIALRDGRHVKATGTCEIFHRNDGKLSVISCLAKAGSRWIAANFVSSFP